MTSDDVRYQWIIIAEGISRIDDRCCRPKPSPYNFSTLAISHIYPYTHTYMHKERQVNKDIDDNTVELPRNDDVNSMFNCTMFGSKKREIQT